MAAMMTVRNPGDKVIIFLPVLRELRCGYHPVRRRQIYVPLVPPDFHFDANVLENAFRQHPKAIILCNPSNPCGKVFTRAELPTIAALAEKYDTYVITDEVYEHIVFAPNKHTYFATLPGMWERTLSCSSLSKTYSVTGWRLGYIIAPPEIIDRAKKVHDFLTVGAAAPLQEAVVTGLKMGQDYYDDLQAKYTHKKDLFLKGLDDLKIAHTDPQGAYYVLLDIAEFGYERSCVLRGSGALCRRRRGSRIELLPYPVNNHDSPAFLPRRTRRCSIHSTVWKVVIRSSRNTDKQEGKAVMDVKSRCRGRGNGTTSPSVGGSTGTRAGLQEFRTARRDGTGQVRHSAHACRRNRRARHAEGRKGQRKSAGSACGYRRAAH